MRKDIYRSQPSQIEYWNIGRSVAFCGKALFNVMLAENGKYFVYVNGKAMGPYYFAGYINCQSEVDWQYIYVRELDPNSFYLKTSRSEFGPYPIVDFDNLKAMVGDNNSYGNNWYYGLVNNNGNTDKYNSHMSIIANGQWLDYKTKKINYYTAGSGSKNSVMILTDEDYYKAFLMD